LGDSVTIVLRTLGVLDLSDRDGRTVDTVLRQPKRLALLSYLAARRPAPVESRDVLFALFWPQLDQAHARNALNKTLHFLRRTLGEGVVVSHGRSRVGVDLSRVDCDAFQFRSALEVDARERALGLFRGEFMPGLHVADARGFEDWVDGQRRWYRDQARATALYLVDNDLGRGRTRSAVEWSVLLNRIAPNDEEIVRASVKALMRAGDRPGAIQRLELYESWLREEVGTGVPADLVRLLAVDAVPPTPALDQARTNDPPPELLDFSRDAVKVETLEEFTDFVDQMPDIVYRCDIRGSFPFVNEMFVRQTGYSREDLRDTQYHEIIREDFQDRAVEFYVRQVDDRIPVTYLEFPAVRKDGSEFWVGQRVRLLLKDGEPVGTQAVTRDITSRVRREAATRRTLLEDRETRLLNRDSFTLLGRQRIRENRRSGDPFFTLHVCLRRRERAAPGDITRAGNAVLSLAGLLTGVIRESDAIARIDELELVVLCPSGGRDQADVMLRRVDLMLADAHAAPEIADFTFHCEAVAHDPAKLRSSDALKTFAWVVEE